LSNKIRSSAVVVGSSRPTKTYQDALIGNGFQASKGFTS